MTHSQLEEKTDTSKKPLPKWLKITGGIFAGLFVIGGIGAIFEGDPDSVEVPDVIGLPGNDAQDELRELEFSPKNNALDGSAVFNVGNWEVDSTEPEPGEMIPEGGEITLNLVRPAEDEEVEETVEDTADEPDEEGSEFDISHDPDDFQEAGGTTFVEFEISDNFSQGLIATGAQRNTFEALEAAIDEHPETGRVQIIGSFPTVDEYGNQEMSDILQPIYMRETIDQINFDNWASIDIWELRDGGMVNQQLMDNR